MSAGTPFANVLLVAGATPRAPHPAWEARHDAACRSADATLTTAWAPGCRAPGRRCTRGRSGLAPCRFADVDLPGHGRARSPGVDAVALARAPRRTSIAATTGWPGWACSRTASLKPRSGGARALGRHRVARGAGHQHLGHPADRARLSPPRRRRRAAAGLPLRADPQHRLAGQLRGRALGLTGPSWVVSTACSSSAKVFAAAARLIEAGLVDAAVVGGVDSLCLTTLYGFNSLRTVLARDLPALGRPAASGISLGEGRGLRPAGARARRAAPAGMAARRGREQRCASHERAASGGCAAPRPRCGGAGRRRPRSRGRSTTSTCMAPARRATTPPKTARCSRVRRAARPAVRPRAPPATRSGAAGGVEAVISLLALQAGLMPGGPEPATSATRRCA